MTSHTSPVHDNHLTSTTVQGYLDYLERCRCKGITFEAHVPHVRKFVPRSAIRRYFDLKQDSYNLRKLVDAATNGCSEPPDIRTIAQRCPVVFSILISIGQSDFISSFTQNDDLQDHRLPFGPDKAQLFPKLEGDQSFWEEFNAKQWEFCVESLTLNLDSVTFGHRKILPITIEQELAKRDHAGASALVQKIRVHEEYDALEYQGDDGQSSPPCKSHVYVLKTYHHPNAEKYFDAEVGAFRKLNGGGEPVRNLIGFCGAFRQNGSFNVVLEYANIGTLDDYFKLVSPPKGGQGILTVWQNLFKINDALIIIHGAPSEERGDKCPRIFHGWHQDIKPANILVSGDIEKAPYDVRFMLADLGLSHFAAVVNNQDDPTGEDRGGTRAYSAPERNLRHFRVNAFKPRVKQTSDVWSLGCVYSEFTAWVVEGWYGERGVIKFREARQEGVRLQNELEGAYFHNSRGDLLEIVEQWHGILVNHSARHDQITPLLWSGLLQDMLDPNSSTRPFAAQVKSKSTRVLRQAQNTLSTRLRTSTEPIPSRPRTPPNIPPEYQNRQSDAGIIGSSPFATPPTIQEKSRAIDIYHPEAFTRSPDSLQSDSPGLNQSENQQSPPLMRDLQDIPSIGLRSESNYLSSNLGHHPDTNVANNGGEAADLSQTSIDPHLVIQPDHQSLQEDITSQPPTKVSIRPRAAPQHEYQVSNSSNGTPMPHLSNRPRHSGEAEAVQYLSVEDLHYWAQLTRNSQSLFGLSSREHFLPHEKAMIVDLKGRDHLFMIDDSQTMKPHWPELVKLFHNLILLVKKKKLDSNGAELRFTISDLQKEAKDTTELVTMVKTRGHQLAGQSNFAGRLEHVLQAYQKKVEAKKTIKPLSIYVFTDGVWQPRGQPEWAARAIQRMVKVLEENNKMDKMVGIQFIQFGNDPEGTERLKWLDANLKKDLGLQRDICDTESARGNVWKMLLGSINDYWDNDPED